MRTRNAVGVRTIGECLNSFLGFSVFFTGDDRYELIKNTKRMFSISLETWREKKEKKTVTYFDYEDIIFNFYLHRRYINSLCLCFLASYRSIRFIRLGFLTILFN